MREEEPLKPLINVAFPVGREMVLRKRIWIAHEDCQEDVKLAGLHGVRVRVLGLVDLDKGGYLFADPPEPGPREGE